MNRERDIATLVQVCCKMLLHFLPLQWELLGGKCFPQLAQMLTLKLAKRETENGECFELGGVEGPVTYVRLPFFLFFF